MTEAEQDAALLALFEGFDQETNDREMAAARAAEPARIAAALAAEAARLAGVQHWLGLHTRSIGCGRCGGRGYLPSFQHIKGGECFACGGQG
jgi:hypothetical protein